MIPLRRDHCCYALPSIVTRLNMFPDKLHSDILEKFLKFGVVGFSGIFVDFGVTYLSIEKLKVHKYIANSLGFIVATISNYLLNRYWTFNTGQGAQFVQFGKFLG